MCSRRQWPPFNTLNFAMGGGSLVALRAHDRFGVGSGPGLASGPKISCHLDISILYQK